MEALKEMAIIMAGVIVMCTITLTVLGRMN